MYVSLSRLTRQGAERGEAHQRESRRAVDQHVVVERAQFADRLDKRQVEIRSLPLSLVRQIEASQCRARRENVDPRISRAANEEQGTLLSTRVEEPFHTGHGLRRIEEGTREIGLCVGVDHQHLEPAFLADRGEQPCGVRLADAALQIDDGDSRGVAGLVIGHAGSAYQPYNRDVQKRGTSCLWTKCDERNTRLPRERGQCSASDWFSSTAPVVGSPST